MKKKITPKQRILKEWPGSFSFSWANGWTIYRPHPFGNQSIGTGKTPALAWANALEILSSNDPE